MVVSSFSLSEVGRRSLRTTVADVVELVAAVNLALFLSAERAAAAQRSKTRWALKPVLAEVMQPSKTNRSSRPLVSARILNKRKRFIFCSINRQ